MNIQLSLENKDNIKERRLFKRSFYLFIQGICNILLVVNSLRKQKDEVGTSGRCRA